MTPLARVHVLEAEHDGRSPFREGLEPAPYDRDAESFKSRAIPQTAGFASIGFGIAFTADRRSGLGTETAQIRRRAFSSCRS
jgi:hypothetical protein